MPAVVPVCVPLTEIVLLQIFRTPEVEPPRRFITVVLDEPDRFEKMMLLPDIESAGSFGDVDVCV